MAQGHDGPSHAGVIAIGIGNKVTLKTESSPAPKKSSAGNTEIVSFDLLRGLAAVAVLIGHVRGSAFVSYADLEQQSHGPVAAVFYLLTRVGHESVLVFFVLSGFLVGGQIIRHSAERRFEISTYCFDRSTRILLPLIPACILSATVDFTQLGMVADWYQACLNMVGLNAS